MNVAIDNRPAANNVDMFQMVILRRRFETIIREMVDTLFRSGRSGVLNTAMDFTCNIVDAKVRSITTALGLPIHAGAIDLIAREVKTKFKGRIADGDCYANNSGYHGNTHCGDFTLCVPVFVAGRLAFYAIARAHLSDMGFPTPTTYGPMSKDVYEEGLQVPCVRVQRNREDNTDVLDICKANIRAPERFYGDYLACLGAVRTGERALHKLCEEYGLETIEAFLDQYQAYAEDMAVAAIRKLPAGELKRGAFPDSDPAEYPKGVPPRARPRLGPEEASIEVDLRHNVDNLPLGINMTESTTLASCRNAVLNVLGPDVPRCTGAYNRVRVLMREGSAVGKPLFPAGTSAATTNLTQVLAPLVQSMFAELAYGLGASFPTVGNPASCPTVSGFDSRHGGRRFVNQIIIGYWGGPAVYGHDGWLTYGASGSAGTLWQSSIEIIEQQQPVFVERLELAVDSGGAGEWEGAPGAHCVYRMRNDAVRITVNAAGRDFPPQGVAGGEPGGKNRIWRISVDGERTELPSFLDIVLQPGEKLETQVCGAGGYGNPLARAPEAVARRVSEGWITRQRARDIYGVVLAEAAGIFHLDAEATAALRQSRNVEDTTQAH
ncbi:MAG TPA: hydantoinase B/oxoprolinase family protein [Rhodocyclaceae bacterium]|nr:hydantoinase B/oxoprolinase family protein [Rhodocyclaceae bacterium]